MIMCQVDFELYISSVYREMLLQGLTNVLLTHLRFSQERTLSVVLADLLAAADRRPHSTRFCPLPRRCSRSRKWNFSIALVASARRRTSGEIID